MNEQITDRGTPKRFHTKFHTMKIMRSGERLIKYSISRACRNHAFGIHESRQNLTLTLTGTTSLISMQSDEVASNYKFVFKLSNKVAFTCEFDSYSERRSCVNFSFVLS